MKIIPYLRFAWAGQIIIESWSYTSFANSLGDVGYLLDLFWALFALTFVLYCLVMGIQELKDRQFVDGKYFYAFGTLYEIMIFTGGLYILSFVPRADLEIWQMGIIMFWNITLFAIVYIDIRRAWTS